MKKILYLLIITATCIVTFYGCSKDIHERTADIAALDPAKTDSNGGTWKTILLTRPDTFLVSVPGANTAPFYNGELNEIKGLQANMTDAQREIVAYWSAGSVLRWNEVMRELVAKYNLPPYQNADGTYPAPSAANPFAYPLFPFANPPYAARAYAYIAAAQYDALVAAWYYKKLYKRPAPYAKDSSINALVPRSSLPSYPSEDAVVAGVTAEMMKLLFPTEIGYIEQKVAEAEYARLAAGANVRSDIDAGEALGRAVAKVFTARGRTDKAGKAVGSPADWAKLESDCMARGERPWLSLESPKRPPMLCFFGNVKAFLFDSVTKVSLTAAAPPATGSQQFKDETNEIKNMTSSLTRDQIALVHFWADGAGTYTPPGHWNAIAAEDFIPKRFSELRWARNMALLNMSLMDAGIVCWATKYKYFNPRPSDVDPAIKTITGVPNFPAYISGHSTFSGAAATILGYIIPEKAAAYNGMAADASVSRMYGGIHYRSDCEKGLQAGKKTGSFAVARAMTDGAD